jgi:hypothetical protein
VDDLDDRELLECLSSNKWNGERVHHIPYWHGVWRGIAIGLGLGAVFGIVTWIGYLLAGSEVFTQKVGPIGLILLAHLVGGSSGGLLAGLLHRWINSSLRATLAGVISMVPYTVAIGIARSGAPFRWGSAEFVVISWVAIMFGGLLGRETWKNLMASSSDE